MDNFGSKDVRVLIIWIHNIYIAMLLLWGWRMCNGKSTLVVEWWYPNTREIMKNHMCFALVIFSLFSLVLLHSWCNGYHHSCFALVEISITSLVAGYHHATTCVHFPLHIRLPHRNTTLHWVCQIECNSWISWVFLPSRFLWNRKVLLLVKLTISKKHSSYH